MSLWQLGNASAVYGAGFFALFLLFALLYRRAYTLRDELGLTPLEVFDVTAFARHHLMSAFVGALSLAFALFAPLRLVFIAPMFFALMGPAHWWLGRVMEQKRLALIDALAGQPAATIRT